MTKFIRRHRGHVSGRKPIAPSVRKPAPPVLRRPLTEKCYAVLDALRREGCTEEVRSVCAALWREWWNAGPDEASDAHTAGLMCYTGWTVAMAHGDARAAARAMDAYFRHPAADADERATRVTYRCMLALSLLDAGEETEALPLYRLLLAARQRDSARLALTTARGQLLAYCRSREGDRTAPAELAVLVRDIAARLRRKRNAARIAPGEASYALLAEVLESTGPSREAPGGPPGETPAP